MLLTGARGQLGYELRRTLAPLGLVIACDRTDLDLADPASIRKVVRATDPRLIVNAAAYTAVDQAESEPELAMVINGVAPGILAEEAERIGGAIVHYSTDYVFDGEKNGPYVEDDLPNPLNVYGRTKLVGEQAVRAAGAAHLILRTSWIYGTRGRNFMRTIQRRALRGQPLKVVQDQTGAPTWSRLVAEATASAVAHAGSNFGKFSGLYHLSCAGTTTWYGFAKAILHAHTASSVREIEAIDAVDYPAPARRPKNSLLSCARIRHHFDIELPSWQDSLMLCLNAQHDQCRHSGGT
jgi:dTDP-4-dehydrorhamnose reductase